MLQGQFHLIYGNDADEEHDGARDWSPYPAEEPDVQAVIEALIDVWTEELVSGDCIELENFLVLEVKEIDRGERRGAC
ncbi:MAG: HU family DNA-binding protein [Anaerolineae bacterium]|nr:HU family DNA-binding protein [Anaerolineae bacterium]